MWRTQGGAVHNRFYLYHIFLRDTFLPSSNFLEKIGKKVKETNLVLLFSVGKSLEILDPSSPKQKNIWRKKNSKDCNALADSRGRQVCAPPLGPFFYFHAVFGEKGQNNRFLWLPPPPQGNPGSTTVTHTSSVSLSVPRMIRCEITIKSRVCFTAKQNCCVFLKSSTCVSICRSVLY